MIFAILLAAAVSVPATADRASDAQLACYKWAVRHQGQRGMNVCARVAYDRAEKVLQAQWTQLLDVVKDNAQEAKRLKSSQQAWLAYRAAWCTAAAWEDRNQSSWEQIHAGCLAELTRRRTKELEDLLLGEGY